MPFPKLIIVSSSTPFVSGQAAINVINTGENRLMLDAVVCDMRMPKINGVEAIAYFRDHFPHVPHTSNGNSSHDHFDTQVWPLHTLSARSLLKLPEIIGLPQVYGSIRSMDAHRQTSAYRTLSLAAHRLPDTQMAVSCMREGVVDYLVKPVDGLILLPIVCGVAALGLFTRPTRWSDRARRI